MLPNTELPQSGKPEKTSSSPHRPDETVDNHWMIDPVCFVRVNPDSSHSMEFDGVTYRFCGESCYRKFCADPEWYLPRNRERRIDMFRSPKAPAGAEIIYATRYPERGVDQDPVCNMTVTPESPHRLSFQGNVLWFCTDRCLEKFRAWPERYLGKHQHNGRTRRRLR